MPPIVSILGKSGAGKTTLLEALIPALARRGYRTAVIKHTSHGFDLDREGKDSYRLQKAGANPGALASSSPAPPPAGPPVPLGGNREAGRPDRDHLPQEQRGRGGALCRWPPGGPEPLCPGIHGQDCAGDGLRP